MSKGPALFESADDLAPARARRSGRARCRCLAILQRRTDPVFGRPGQEVYLRHSEVCCDGHSEVRIVQVQIDPGFAAAFSRAKLERQTTPGAPLSLCS